MKKAMDLRIRIFSTFTILYIVLISISMVTAENFDREEWPKYFKGSPILNATIVPGFVLFEECKYRFLPVVKMNNFYEVDTIMINKRFENTNRVKRERECWATLSQQELSKRRKLSGTKVPVWSLLIIRYSFGSRNDAELFANALQGRQGELSELPESGKTLGEKSWSNKNSSRVLNEKSTLGYSICSKIIFIRGTTVVVIDGGSGPIDKNPNPMPFEFVEKVARAIDQKLK